MNHNYDYIKRAYGLDFKRLQRVMALGRPGVVTGTESAHLMVKLDDMEFSRPYHPTDVIPHPEPAP